MRTRSNDSAKQSRAIASTVLVSLLAACGVDSESRPSGERGSVPALPALPASAARSQPMASGSAPRASVPDSATAPAGIAPDLGPNAPLAGLPSGEASRVAVCERARTELRNDRVTDAFCAEAPPAFTSLVELQAALGLAVSAQPAMAGEQPANDQQTQQPAPSDPGFALLGHSASLSARGTSAINPRAILFTNLTSDQGLVTMGFTRGEQAVELIARDRDSDELNFYLLAYRQPCNDAHACMPSDTLTPNTESGWTQWSLYAGQDLENTVLDCTSCHVVADQDGKPRAILRLQELTNPWTHWFRSGSFGGAALIEDFQAAHAEGEAYAGIPGNRIQSSEPALLQALVTREGFANQPNLFATAAIELQVYNSSPEQPGDNSQPGASAVWNTTYTNFIAGDAIPVPYHDVKVTDATKLMQMTAAYNEFMLGGMAAQLMPDIREVFLEDRLHEMAGIRIDPMLTGQALVTAACTQCHNSRLNQQITRARFNADLSQFSDLIGGVMTGPARDAQLRLAIARVQLPPSDHHKMPPERLRSLSSAQIAELEAYFCAQMESPDEGCPAVAGR